MACQSRNNLDCCTAKKRFGCPWCILTLFDDNEKEWLIELFEERAAIVEYDGGLPRADAEQIAMLEVLKKIQTL
jgi:hypothetical protein